MCWSRITYQGQGWAINGLLNSGYGSLRKFHKGEDRLLTISVKNAFIKVVARWRGGVVLCRGLAGVVVGVVGGSGKASQKI